MSNNNNPYDLDQEQVRDKGTDNGVVRATVLDTMPETHTVRVNPRGDNAPVIAPVLTPTYGSQTLPQAGERVMLLYVAENTPICLGSIYLLDGVQPPNGENGDLILGNDSGSAMTVHEDGRISLITDEKQPIDIDNQSASVYLGTDYSVPDNGYTKVPFDVVKSDAEELFRPDTHDFQTSVYGLYGISASVEIPSAGQNNSYTLAIFVNNEEKKRVTRQSAVNAPLSVQVTASEYLDTGDIIDIRIENNSSSNKTITGSDLTTDFNIRREGI